MRLLALTIVGVVLGTAAIVAQSLMAALQAGGF